MPVYVHVLRPLLTATVIIATGKRASLLISPHAVPFICCVCVVRPLPLLFVLCFCCPASIQPVPIPVHVLRTLGLRGGVRPVSSYVRSRPFPGGGGSVPPVRGPLFVHRRAPVHARY